MWPPFDPETYRRLLEMQHARHALPCRDHQWKPEQFGATQAEADTMARIYDSVAQTKRKKR